MLRRFRGDLSDESDDLILEVARALARQGTLEGRQAGYELLAGRPGVVEALSTSGVEELGRGNDNWASVDGFACLVAGPAWRAGRVSDADVERWARSEDPWWRRTALVSTVPLNRKSRGGSGDVPRTLRICRLLAGDSHDVVAKALSWALREIVPHDPDAARAFLAEHEDTLPARVKREVTNKLETGRKSG